MCVDILFAFLVQLCAAELLCESGDADDVSRFQMFVEEITAGLGYVLHLISYRRKKKTQEVRIFNLKGIINRGELETECVCVFSSVTNEDYLSISACYCLRVFTS